MPRNNIDDDYQLRINADGEFEFIAGPVFSIREFNCFRALRSAKPTHSVLHEVGLSDVQFQICIRKLKQKLKVKTRNELVRMAILYFRTESDDLPQMAAGTPCLKG